jgi:hypothetical protein
VTNYNLHHQAGSTLKPAMDPAMACQMICACTTLEIPVRIKSETLPFRLTGLLLASGRPEKMSGSR